MSGGSYDYLCYAVDRGDLGERGGMIDAMARRLEELGHREAARATRNVSYLLGGAERAARALTDVWRAVEWLDSGDSGEETVAKAVAGFRPWPPPAPSDDSRKPEMSDEEFERRLRKWIRASPQEFESWLAKRQRMHGGRLPTGR